MDYVAMSYIMQQQLGDRKDWHNDHHVSPRPLLYNHIIGYYRIFIVSCYSNSKR